MRGAAPLSLPAESASGDRTLSASILLSSVGAGVAGIGLGVLAAGLLEPVGAPLLVIGLAAHLVGMVGRRRAESAQRYRPTLWEHLAYWGCWAGIGGLLLFGAIEAAF